MTVQTWRLTWVNDAADPDAYVDLLWDDVSYAIVDIRVVSVREGTLAATFHDPAGPVAHTIAAPGQDRPHPFLPHTFSPQYPGGPPDLGDWRIETHSEGFHTTQTFSASGTWSVAGGTASQAECWAGGGGGSGGGTRAGGGGGGAYSLATGLNLASPQTVTVGTGGAATSNGNDSWFGTTGTVLAKGGLGTAGTTGGAGGAAGSGVGTTKHSGGAGGNGGVSVGGGGGGGAGSGGDGGAGAGSTGGTGTATAGGNGGNGDDGASTAEQPGSTMGGGGGGSGAFASGSGAAGARGQVIVTYSVSSSGVETFPLQSPPPPAAFPPRPRDPSRLPDLLASILHVPAPPSAALTMLGALPQALPRVAPFIGPFVLAPLSSRLAVTPPLAPDPSLTMLVGLPQALPRLAPWIGPFPLAPLEPGLTVTPPAPPDPSLTALGALPAVARTEMRLAPAIGPFPLADMVTLFPPGPPFVLALVTAQPLGALPAQLRPVFRFLPPASLPDVSALLAAATQPIPPAIATAPPLGALPQALPRVGRFLAPTTVPDAAALFPPGPSFVPALLAALPQAPPRSLPLVAPFIGPFPLAPLGPIFLLPPASPLAISTTSLPAATISVAYSTTLAGTGGTTPYTWSLASGSLPAGLSLAGSTGVISGTPSAGGAASFTVKLTDQAGRTTTAVLTLVVWSLPYAQIAPTMTPVITAVLRAKRGSAARLDPTSLYTNTLTDVACAVAAPGNGNVVRAHLSGGNVQTQTLAAASGSAWTTWTTRAAATAPAGGLGVALAALADTVALAYVKSGATTTVSVMRSTDDGATWSAAVDVANTGVVTDVALAYAPNGDLLLLTGDNGGTMRAFRSNGGGAWGAAVTPRAAQLRLHRLRGPGLLRRLAGPLLLGGRQPELHRRSDLRQRRPADGQHLVGRHGRPGNRPRQRRQPDGERLRLGQRRRPRPARRAVGDPRRLQRQPRLRHGVLEHDRLCRRLLDRAGAVCLRRQERRRSRLLAEDGRPLRRRRREPRRHAGPAGRYRPERPRDQLRPAQRPARRDAHNRAR